MGQLKSQVLLIAPLLLLLLLSLVNISHSALPECKNLKEDLPDGMYEYSQSLRKDLSVLGMVLDELLPFGHAYEVETVLTKARDLVVKNDWDLVNSRYYLEQLKSNGEHRGPPLAGAINLFHSMRDCLYRCDYTSSLALAAAHIAVFENELYTTDDDRVKWSILKVVEVHRNKCMPGYLEEFRTQKTKLGSDLMKKLDSLFDSELTTKILGGRHVKDVSAAQIGDQLLQKRSELFDRVAVVVKDTDEAKYVSAKRSGFGRYDYEVPPEFKFKTLAKHVFEPCRKFVRQFRDIFYPMRLDFILMNGSSVEEMDISASKINDSSQDKEFMDFWTKYRLCKELSVERARYAELITSEVAQKLGLITPVNVKLSSADDETFEVDRDILSASKTIIKLLDKSKAGAEGPPKVENVSGSILGRVIRWITYHRGQDSEGDREDNWNLEFFKANQDTLYDLLLAADSLEIGGLLVATSRAIANQIKRTRDLGKLVIDPE